jgi:propanediol dehydratase small subunit
MTGRERLKVGDYPLAEKRPDLVNTGTGHSLEAITLEGVVSGGVTMADLRITPEALRLQAEIADGPVGRRWDELSASELVDAAG